MAVPIVYTNFVPPAIDAGNLNTVNTVVYTVIGDGTNAPATAADVRTNIGLGTIATQSAGAVAITGGTAVLSSATISGGTITGITDLAIADGGTGASTAAAARTNLNVPQIGPTFSATLSANQALVSGTPSVIIYNVEDFDTDSYYDTATGRFTPLVAGYYQMNWATISSSNGNVAISNVTFLAKNGTSFARGFQLDSPAGAGVTISSSNGSAVVLFNGTTDFVDVRLTTTNNAGNPVALGGVFSKFSGHFIRP